MAVAVVSACSANQIRAHGLANLHRWKQRGVWVSAYEEWQAILESASDGELFAAMLGQDERSNRLRQSPRLLGLLAKTPVSKDLRDRIRRDIAADFVRERDPDRGASKGA